MGVELPRAVSSGKRRRLEVPARLGEGRGLGASGNTRDGVIERGVATHVGDTAGLQCIENEFSRDGKECRTDTRYSSFETWLSGAIGHSGGIIRLPEKNAWTEAATQTRTA